jgi:hypothetical protein
MSIRFAPEPKNGSTIVRAGLEKLAARRESLSPAKVAMEQATIEAPHAVYDLRADEIANGGGLETAHLSGFRYLVRKAGAAIAAAEVQTDQAGDASLLANLNYGPYVVASAMALNELSSRASEENYEARLLRFAAIYLVAVWLKADKGSADIVYPLQPAPAGIEAGRRYTVPQFLEAIVPLAQKRIRNAREGQVP